MLLGHYCHHCPPVAGAPRFLRAEGFFGTHAYLLRRSALRRLFAYPALMPVRMQIDAGARMGGAEGLGGGRRGVACQFRLLRCVPTPTPRRHTHALTPPPPTPPPLRPCSAGRDDSGWAAQRVRAGAPPGGARLQALPLLHPGARRRPALASSLPPSPPPSLHPRCPFLPPFPPPPPELLRCGARAGAGLGCPPHPRTHMPHARPMQIPIKRWQLGVDLYEHGDALAPEPSSSGGTRGGSSSSGGGGGGAQNPLQQQQQQQRRKQQRGGGRKSGGGGKGARLAPGDVADLAAAA